MNVSSTNISWFEVANFGDLFIYINSYKICLNGLIDQWGALAKGSNLEPRSGWYPNISLLIPFSSWNYTLTFGVSNNFDASGFPGGCFTYAHKGGDIIQMGIWNNFDSMGTMPILSYRAVGY